MKLAITGGAGFLGYHLCQELAARYEEILVLDPVSILSSEYPANVRHLAVDVADSEQVRRALEKTDQVIHAAASLPLHSARQIMRTNVDGTRNVLQAALDYKLKSVVYISSTAVYGVPEKHPLFETDPMVGVGPYGESKIQAEKLCQEYRQKGLCVSVIRPKTFIGTGRLGVFQILYDWIYSGKKIPVIGSGHNRYQLLEVTDLASAVGLLLSLPQEKTNDVFNIGAERFGTVREDLGALCEVAGSGAQIMSTPGGLVKGALALFEAMHLSPLYKWVYGTADKDSFVSVDKLKNQLGWKAQYSNAEALIRSYQWFLQHRTEITTGLTHRVAWKQGILGLFKRIL